MPLSFLEAGHWCAYCDVVYRKRENGATAKPGLSPPHLLAATDLPPRIVRMSAFLDRSRARTGITGDDNLLRTQRRNLVKVSVVSRLIHAWCRPIVSPIRTRCTQIGNDCICSSKL